MKNLLRYLKNYRIECVLAPLFKMLEASFELAIPLVVANLIDKGINSANISEIYKCFAIMILLGFIGLISSCTAQFFAAKAATGFSKELREDLFSHLLHLSFTEIDNIGTSTMITRMTSDVNQAQTGVNMFLRLFLRSPFVVFGAMIMAFTIDVRSALIFVYVILCLSLVVFIVMKINIPDLKRVQMLLDNVLLHTRENLAGARVIRALTKEDDENEIFIEANEELLARQIGSGRVSGALNPITYVIVNMGIVCLIYTGAIRIEAGLLTQGMIIALYNYMSQILVELIKLANLIVTLNKSLASASRISDVFLVKSSQKDGEILITDEMINNSDMAVVFDNVSLKYNDNGDDAVENISFSVKRGETIGIIGGTGSGKTSLISLIPRLYDATKGSVFIYGNDAKTINIESLRRRIGLVIQKAALFKGTILENIAYGLDDISVEDATIAADLAVALDVVKAKGGFDGEVAQAGKNLSGGQRQRLTIARALAKKPDILILDDSASALDFATEKKLNQNIKSLDEKVTTFIVTQRTSSILHADKIIVLDDGKMVGCGRHDDLLESCDIYREIYATQFEIKKENEGVQHE